MDSSASRAFLFSILSIAVVAVALKPAVIARLPTGQVLHVSADSAVFFGRPSDIAMQPLGTTLAIKTSHGLVFTDVRTFKPLQSLRFPDSSLRQSNLGGAAPIGVSWSSNDTVWTCDGYGTLFSASRRSDGSFSWSTVVHLPPGSAPAAVAADARRHVVYVALMSRNAVAVVDLRSFHILHLIQTDAVPYNLLLSGNQLFVTSLGRDIDPKTGAGRAGKIDIIDARTDRLTARISVQRLPTGLAVSRSGNVLFVSNAGSDSVSRINVTARRVTHTIRLGAGLLGRIPGALALSTDTARLYVAESGANAIAVLSTDGKLIGRIETGWYPSGIVARGHGEAVVVDMKGVGSRGADYGLPLTVARHRTSGYNVYDYSGVLERVHESDAIRSTAAAPRTPAFEKTAFKHVIYIIKENHTYDDFFGDIAEANGDPRLCPFGQEVTPNQHALAREFGIFDNFFVNGTLSADGHQWTDEGIANDYVERAMPAFARSYPSDGTDPLAFAQTGFIWNDAVKSGKSVKVYGEFVRADVAIQPPNATWTDLYRAQQRGERVHFKQEVPIAAMRAIISRDYPGFSLKITDQYRADIFLRDLQSAQASGRMPSLTILQLGNDHTSGTDPGYPTPRAAVADNDLALGRIVSGVTRSRFWRDTAIFVVEDDAQDGLDHVDGHRTAFLLISAYNRRHFVDSRFYNQSSLLRTIEIALGLRPLTMFDAAAHPILPFASAADLKPYDVRRNLIPLDEMNPSLSALHGSAREKAVASMRADFSAPDRAAPGLLLQARH